MRMRLVHLSGAIEWRLRRLESAERIPAGATIDLGECEAALDLGVVPDDLESRVERSRVRQARQCYSCR